MCECNVDETLLTEFFPVKVEELETKCLNLNLLVIISTTAAITSVTGKLFYSCQFSVVSVLAKKKF